MPKASEIAVELRKLADALDKGGDTEMEQPLVSMGSDEKECFLAIARLMPRPFTKKFSDFCGTPSIELDHVTPALRVWAKAPRDRVCSIVRPAIPAEYDCEPLLSAEEEESLA